MRRIAASASIVVILGGAAALAQPAQPTLTETGLVYPNDQPVPRYMTEIEEAYWREHPPTTRTTPPPMSPVYAAPEYAPTSALCIAWEGGTTLTNILADMAVHLTDRSKGDADLYIACDSSAVASSAQTTLQARGVNLARIHYVIRTMDSIWMRDYGPRYIYQGQCRAIVDHVYNRPRPNDNTFPVAFGTLRHHARYEIPLVHGGGNYHLDGNGFGYCSQLVLNENNGGGDLYNYTEAQIHDLWLAYQNCDTQFFTPFPTTVDSTQHIDMWLITVADDRVIISDWPSNPGSAQDVICDNAATFMAGRGFTVYRVPAFSVGGVHYTYTNAVICNNVVLVPTYTNSTVSPNNAAALAMWQAACPGKTIVGVNAQNIIGLAGAFHGIVMHVPAHLGGVNPTAFLTALRGMQSLVPADSVNITWITDDDEAVSNVDLLLSTDGGQTYPTTLAAAIADSGSFTWTVPNVTTSRARLKIIARDAQGNTGSDQSDTNFAIGTNACIGDLSGDGVVDLSDLAVLLSNFGARQASTAMGDADGDFDVDLSDLAGMLSAYGTVCP
ncbi:MAG: agmatine deiminase family protein [Planctomycetes bacterium]|nr:agmatine deiminase family protein [Planctomycetota bacterium]